MVILDLYYLTMVLAVISLAQYVARNMRPESLKVFRWVLFWVYAATIVLVAADHWTGIIYTVTAQGEYIRGKAYMLPCSIAFGLYVVLFTAMLRGRGAKALAVLCDLRAAGLRDEFTICFPRAAVLLHGVRAHPDRHGADEGIPAA